MLLPEKAQGVDHESYRKDANRNDNRELPGRFFHELNLLPTRVIVNQPAG